MDDRELDAIIARAFRALERAERQEPSSILVGFRRALRLWHYPKSQACRSWTVFVHSKRPTIVTRMVTWDRPADFRRAELDVLEGGAPTLMIADGVVPNHELDLLLDLGSRLHVPLLGFKRTTQSEGERFGVEIQVGLSRSTFEWSDAPEAWTQLAEWAARVRELLQRCADGG